MDAAYPAPVAGLKENADPKSAFTRFHSGKRDFVPSITKDTVPASLFSTFKVQIGPPRPSKASTSVRSTAKMPYNNTAIPPPEEITGSASLPRACSYRLRKVC